MIIRSEIPLTPALSPSEWERENRLQSLVMLRVWIYRTTVAQIASDQTIFPLSIRWGEGQGEGLVRLATTATE